MKALAAALLLLCITAGVWADDTAQSQQPVADSLFTLTAEYATFTTANTLTLMNTSATALFYGKGARAAIIPTQTFVNGTAGGQYVAKNGLWLNNPSATLIGFDVNSTQHAILLTLAKPTAVPENKTVTFTVTFISNATDIKTSKGVTNAESASASNQDGMLLTAIQPGTGLYDVGLFVDVNSASVAPEAQTKDWYRHDHYNRGYYPYYDRDYHGCGGCGYYNRGWGGPGFVIAFG